MTPLEPTPDAEAPGRSSEQEAAARELLSRLGEAYKALDQAEGWIKEADPSLFGFNSAEEVSAHIAKLRRHVEQILDAGQGNRWTQAQVKFETLKPLMGAIFKLLKVLHGL